MGIDAETYAAAKGYTDKMVEGGGGTLDYEALRNHPSINGNELVGDKSSKQLGIQNLFTGTTTEWAQLTTDQKAQYTHVCFTDDTAQELTVVANPEAQATAELTKLQVGQSVYSVPSGAQVADNTGAIEAIVNKYGAKNLCPFPSLSELKAINTSGTWNNNVYSYRGATFTVDETNKTISLEKSTQSAANFALFYLTKDIDFGDTLISTVSSEQQTANGWTISDGNNIATKTVNYGVTYDPIYDVDGHPVYVFIGGNQILSSAVIIKPMIRDARIKDSTYVPYAMTNAELTERVYRKVVTPTINNQLVTSGTVSCQIVGQMCFLTIDGLVFNHSGLSQNGVLTNLPPMRNGGSIAGGFTGGNPTETAAINAGGDMWWINANGTSLNCHLGANSYDTYHTGIIVYPTF